jgi:Na+/melibiose symporter-like transporter
MTSTKQTIRSWRKRGLRLARAVLLALVTPLLEKNPSKTATFSLCYVPMVLSMARVIVLLFAVAMLRQVERAGVAGWPEATLCIAIVLALPLLNALERVSAEETIAVAKALFRRVGVGGTRQIGSVFGEEPSKDDDHRLDDHRTDEPGPYLEEAA